jgi:hypothetical protein
MAEICHHLEIPYMIASVPAPEHDSSNLDHIPAAKLADELGIALRTLDNWVRAGLLPPPVKIRNRRYFKRSEVQTLLNR